MTSASVRTEYDEGDFLIPALDAEGLLDKFVAYTGLMGASETLVRAHPQSPAEASGSRGRASAGRGRAGQACASSRQTPVSVAPRVWG